MLHIHHAQVALSGCAHHSQGVEIVILSEHLCSRMMQHAGVAVIRKIFANASSMQAHTACAEFADLRQRDPCVAERVKGGFR